MKTFTCTEYLVASTPPLVSEQTLVGLNKKVSYHFALPSSSGKSLHNSSATLGSISWPSRPIFTCLPSFQGLYRCNVEVNGNSFLHIQSTLNTPPKALAERPGGNTWKVYNYRYALSSLSSWSIYQESIYNKNSNSLETWTQLIHHEINYKFYILAHYFVIRIIFRSHIPKKLYRHLFAIPYWVSRSQQTFPILSRKISAARYATPYMPDWDLPRFVAACSIHPWLWIT